MPSTCLTGSFPPPFVGSPPSGAPGPSPSSSLPSYAGGPPPYGYSPQPHGYGPALGYSPTPGYSPSPYGYSPTPYGYSPKPYGYSPAPGSYGSPPSYGAVLDLEFAARLQDSMFAAFCRPRSCIIMRHLECVLHKKARCNFTSHSSLCLCPGRGPRSSAGCLSSYRTWCRWLFSVLQLQKHHVSSLARVPGVDRACCHAS